jgi:hypothetical protein
MKGNNFYYSFLTNLLKNKFKSINQNILYL